MEKFKVGNVYKSIGLNGRYTTYVVIKVDEHYVYYHVIESNENNFGWFARGSHFEHTSKYMGNKPKVWKLLYGKQLQNR